DRSDLERALDAGVRYLVGQQRADGGWEDFHSLPVGAATEWITGFVAAALLDAGGPEARAAGGGGGAPPPSLPARGGGGWGVNGATGPDADSTAWSLIAIRAAGADPPPGAVSFLASLRRDDGGFATYPRRDGWGLSHPDVTPVATLALPPPERAQAV